MSKPTLVAIYARVSTVNKIRALNCSPCVNTPRGGASPYIRNTSITSVAMYNSRIGCDIMEQAKEDAVETGSQPCGANAA